MPSRHANLAGVAACAAAVMTPLAASPASAVVSAQAEAIGPVVELTERAHERALRRNVRLHRSNARLLGARADRDRADALNDWSIAHLRERNTELRKRNKALKRRAARAGAPVGALGAAAPVATPAHLQAIAACESGGDPSAVGGGGAYRGKYQFDLGTWASVGGAGDPAAAPEAEQDRRAAMLYARAGASPWPVCGG